MSTSISGKHRLARQSGKWGYFGEVAVDIDRDGSGGAVEITFDPVHALQWQIGARFGIEYVLEQVSQRELFPNGGKIHVSRIVGHLVDTNNVVIAYVTALAVVDALGIEARKVPELVADQGLVIFPK